MITNNLVLQKKAEHGGYAIGHFNADDLNVVKIIIAAAEDNKSDIILACSVGEIKYAGAIYLAAVTYAAARKAKIGISLHLDHGDTFERVKECIAAGFTSVMIDKSKLPFEENVRETKRVVDYAHKYGVVVEGEVGQIGEEDNVEIEKDMKLSYTDPDMAVEFVKRTGVDVLAISIGNAHGYQKKDLHIDFDLLKEIRKKVNVPLALHGSSGIPDDDLKKAIKFGMSKVNVNTEIRKAYTNALRDSLNRQPDEVKLYKYLTPADKAAYDVVVHRLNLYNSLKKKQ